MIVLSGIMSPLRNIHICQLPALELIRRTLYGPFVTEFQLTHIGNLGSILSNNIKSLIPGTWLKGKVLDFIGGLLNFKCTEDGLLQDPKQQSYFIYPFQFRTALLNKGDKFRDGKYTYENVIKYTSAARKDIDIFAFDKVFVPINYQNLH